MEFDDPDSISEQPICTENMAESDQKGDNRRPTISVYIQGSFTANKKRDPTRQTNLKNAQDKLQV